MERMPRGPPSGSTNTHDVCRAPFRVMSIGAHSEHPSRQPAYPRQAKLTSIGYIGSLRSLNSGGGCYASLRADNVRRKKYSFVRQSRYAYFATIVWSWVTPRHLSARLACSDHAKTDDWRSGSAITSVRISVGLLGRGHRMSQSGHRGPFKQTGDVRYGSLVATNDLTNDPRPDDDVAAPATFNRKRRRG